MPTTKKSARPTKSKRSRACCPCGLRYPLAFLPGGIATAMHLAWLSRDERVRDVAQRWRALSTAERDQTDIEELCDEAGVREGEYLGAVMATAFELNINVSAVIGAMTQMPVALMGVLGSVAYSQAGRESAAQVFEFYTRRFRKNRPAHR